MDFNGPEPNNYYVFALSKHRPRKQQVIIVSDKLKKVGASRHDSQCRHTDVWKMTQHVDAHVGEVSGHHNESQSFVQMRGEACKNNTHHVHADVGEVSGHHNQLQSFVQMWGK
jgi:hypothetical protein